MYEKIAKNQFNNDGQNVDNLDSITSGLDQEVVLDRLVEEVTVQSSYFLSLVRNFYNGKLGQNLCQNFPGRVPRSFCDKVVFGPPERTQIT